MHSARPEDPVWNLVDVSAIVAFAVVSLVFIGGLAIGVAHSLPRFHNVSPVDLTQNALVLVSAQTVAYLLVVGFMVQIVRLKRRSDFFAAVSWNMPNSQTAIMALAGGAGLALFSFVFTFLLSKWIPKSLPIDKYFHDASSAYLLAMFGVIVAPFVEELLFRGFLYPALARPIGASASVLITAAAFAVMHQSQLAHAWVPLLWLFMVGVVLTTVRAKTKSVATSVLIHVAYNATIFVFVFIGTQGFHHMERV
ncbi:MAG TPA: CPBP family intramembrane glutamic endopeptidase [Candidatus Angelobacter sp.]|nr:CPBP family intramembrane glutamic endopeptidase [Candidatus Angelobacter sp.]